MVRILEISSCDKNAESEFVSVFGGGGGWGEAYTSLLD